jgi:hypothetical protein
MAIPCSATGYGNNSTARNVFRVTFSQALSSLPKYEAYDGGTFPAVGSGTTTTGKALAGTSGNSNKPMVSLVDTSNAAPTSNWKPTSATAGSANPNRLKGTTNFVTAAGSIPGASGSITFNMVVEVPSDHVTTDSLNPDLLIRYTYTGSVPSLTWAVNEGTEGTPTWTTMTPGTHGIRHTRAGVTSGGPYLANIPGSGTEDTAMGWVTT